MTETKEDSRAEMLRSMTKEVSRKFKLDGPIKSLPESASCLSQLLNTKFKLRLCNLERWRIEREDNTLDFRYSDKEITEKYVELQESMTKYYTELLKYNIGVLSERRIINKMVVAVNLGDGVFRRAFIMETEQDPRSRIDFPKYNLQLLESNTSVWLEPQYRLMYMVKKFLDLPCQVFQFFLKNTEDYHELVEFRDALCSVVSKEDELEAEGHVENEEGVMFVTLWSPKFSDPLNQVLREMTVSALKEPNLPPVGEVFSAVHLSHIEADGVVSLQFGSYVHNLFKEVERSISKSIFDNLSKMGPYSIDTGTIYLNFWESALYRVRIHHKPAADYKAVLVNYIDYGNYEEVAISDLVPCALVSPHFAKFKPQAIQAQLANVASIDVVKLHEMVKLEINPEIYVQTYREATEEGLAVVELLIKECDRRSTNMSVDIVEAESESSHYIKNVCIQTKAATATNAEPSKNADTEDEPSPIVQLSVKVNEKIPFRLSELALNEKFAQAWERPMLSPTATLLRPQRLNLFLDIEATNWSFPSEIPIRLEVGSILDIIVLEVLDISNFVIAPAHGVQLVTDIEYQMSNSTLYALTYKEDYENKFHPSIRNKGFFPKKGMHYALYDEASYPERRYSRVRLIEDPPLPSVSVYSSALKKVEVILIDYGLRQAVALWRLFYLEPQFCRLPPQAALLKLSYKPSSETNPTHFHHMLRNKFHLQRMLVKVFSFKYGSNTGLCLIGGDIYKNFPFGPHVGLTESQTLSAAQAEKIIMKGKVQLQKLLDVCDKKMKPVVPVPAVLPAAALSTTPATAAARVREIASVAPVPARRSPSSSSSNWLNSSSSSSIDGRSSAGAASTG